MQEFIKNLIYYVVLFVIAVLFFFMIDESKAVDYSQYKELSMPNEAGGQIVLTLDECKLEDKIKKEFTSRAYATEPDGTIHEGCWNTPSTQDAPVGDPNIKIIPLVNVIWHTGDITMYLQNQFKPIKPENTI
jgi:hypothetical protein